MGDASPEIKFIPSSLECVVIVPRIVLLAPRKYSVASFGFEITLSEEKIRVYHCVGAFKVSRGILCTYTGIEKNVLMEIILIENQILRVRG